MRNHNKKRKEKEKIEVIKNRKMRISFNVKSIQHLTISTEKSISQN